MTYFFDVLYNITYAYSRLEENINVWSYGLTTFFASFSLVLIKDYCLACQIWWENFASRYLLSLTSERSGRTSWLFIKLRYCWCYNLWLDLNHWLSLLESVFDWDAGLFGPFIEHVLHRILVKVILIVRLDHSVHRDHLSSMHR